MKKLLVALCIVATFLMGGCNSVSTSSNEEQKQSFDIANKSKLSISAHITNIFVRQKDTDKINVKLVGASSDSSNERKFEAKEEGDSLSIDLKEGKTVIGTSKTGLYIDVPKTYTGEINIVTEDGKIEYECDSLNNNINSSSNIGDITFNLPEDSEFSVKAVNSFGKINNNFEFSDESSKDEKNTIGKNLEAKNKSGKYKVEIKSKAGKININKK